MPDISFYILASESVQERYLFVCKLAEKAYRSQVPTYVLVDTPEQSQALDDLLWTFRAGSFIPHQIYTDTLPLIQNTVLIGMAHPPDGWQQLVINVSSHCPANFLAAGRILEVLDNNETTKTQGRERYRHYREAGIAVTTHKL